MSQYLETVAIVVGNAVFPLIFISKHYYVLIDCIQNSLVILQFIFLVSFAVIGILITHQAKQLVLILVIPLLPVVFQVRVILHFLSLIV